MKYSFKSKMFWSFSFFIFGFCTVFVSLFLISRNVVQKKGRAIISNKRIGEVDFLVVDPVSNSKLNISSKELIITKKGQSVLSLELDKNRHLSKALISNKGRIIAKLDRNIEVGRWVSITFISKDGGELTEKFGSE